MSLEPTLPEDVACLRLALAVLARAFDDLLTHDPKVNPHGALYFLQWGLWEDPDCLVWRELLPDSCSREKVTRAAQRWWARRSPVEARS